MKSMSTVFRFSLAQQLKVRSIRVLTVVVALIFFLIPVVIMAVSAKSPSEEEPSVQKEAAEEEPAFTAGIPDSVKEVFYVPEIPDLKTLPLLETGTLEGCENIAFTYAPSVAEASAMAMGKTDAIILRIAEEDGEVLFSSLLPDDSAVNPGDALSVAEAVSEAFPALAADALSLPDMGAKSGLRLEFISPEEEESAVPEETFREEAHGILALLLPYLNILLIYFLVLYYGQSSANSVILEKTSKLMDTFLVAVKPESMILGKVLAYWVAALMQFLIWVAALFAGVNVGRLVVRALSPEASEGMEKLLSLVKLSFGQLTLPAVLLAVLIVIAGFFLYCCMAAIGAAFASKPEELSQTIAFFSLTLVVSMLVTLSAGFLNGEMAYGARWFDFVPFTSILITPSRLLLGKIGLIPGIASLAVTVLLSLIFIVIAGRSYRAMSLYKGNLPKLKDIPRLIMGS